MSKRAVGYIRVSTAQQALEGVSLDAQRSALEAWAGANGYELAEVYIDEGISGRRATNRPGLQAALADVCGGGGALVVYSLSRMARSTRDALTIGERLERAGVDLVSLKEKIDTTTATGKLMYRMLAVLAEFESDIISERTTTGMSEKRAKGEKTGGTVPFGYEVVGHRTVQLKAGGDRQVPVLGEVPDEQAVIELMLDLRVGGNSYRRIVEVLDGQNIGTKDGGRWQPTTVRNIINREQAKRQQEVPA